MSEVKSLEQLSLVLGYLVPGLIIIYVRAQFLTGRLLPHKEAILTPQPPAPRRIDEGYTPETSQAPSAPPQVVPNQPSSVQPPKK